jgi:hypothetical protein
MLVRCLLDTVQGQDGMLARVGAVLLAHHFTNYYMWELHILSKITDLDPQPARHILEKQPALVNKSSTF